MVRLTGGMRPPLIAHSSSADTFGADDDDWAVYREIVS